MRRTYNREQPFAIGATGNALKGRSPMNLKQLEYFISVAEHGSFSKAALVLDIAQAALSRQVRLLETDLRTTLLTRTGRGVVLTEQGQRLFDHSVGILQLLAHAREDIDASRDQPSGRVVVGLPPSISRMLTLPLVQTFGRELPRAKLAVVEGLSTHLTEWIATGRTDIGLVLNPEPQAAIETTHLFDETLCLIGPRNPRRRKEGALAPLPFAELPQYPLVVPDRSHTLRKLVETHAARAGLKLDVAWEVSSVPSILELVRAGMGHAVLVGNAIGTGEQAAQFEVRPIVDPALEITYCLAVSASKPLTPLLRQTMKIVRTLVMNTIAPSPRAPATHPTTHRETR